jgi:hypothetical protein
MDPAPDPTPDLTPFFSDFEGAKKIFFHMFLATGTLSLVLNLG